MIDLTAGPQAQICTPSSTNAISADLAFTLANMLKALAEPLRLRMLSAIATDSRGESCVCDLAQLANVSQPTVSHHLKVLKDTGILTAQRRGTWVWYRISPTQRGAVMALLDTFAAAATAEHLPTAPPAPTLLELEARIGPLAEELAAEYPQLNRELVISIVRESAASLVRSARVTTHLIALTERFARQRLTDLTRDRASGIPQVLFVCVANAGRSQLAATLVNKLAQGKIVARSAGSSPATELHPLVESLLTQIDPDATAERFPKPITDDAVRAADVVITMGCGDACPIIPGIRYEDWAVGDPALASEQGAEAISQDITARVQTLIDSLLPPTES